MSRERQSQYMGKDSPEDDIGLCIYPPSWLQTAEMTLSHKVVKNIGILTQEKIR